MSLQASGVGGLMASAEDASPPFVEDGEDEMADVDAQNLSIEQLKRKLRYQGLLVHFFA
jgi:hypothetical protein